MKFIVIFKTFTRLDIFSLRDWNRITRMPVACASHFDKNYQADEDLQCYNDNDRKDEDEFDQITRVFCFQRDCSVFSCLKSIDIVLRLDADAFLVLDDLVLI